MVTDTETALRFLSEHQPMPSDWDITDAEADAFADILKHFEEHPDDRCVALFIRSVSADTGLGMYKHIRFVLEKQSRNVVIDQLRSALVDPSSGLQSQACWWAIHVDAWELSPVISPLLNHEDSEVRAAAEDFIELRDKFTKPRTTGIGPDC